MKEEAIVNFLNKLRHNEKINFSLTLPYINDLTIDIDDMTAIEDINEMDLLNNIKNRFFMKQIFTNVGATLIVLNPYQIIDKTFGIETIEMYINVNKNCIINFCKKNIKKLKVKSKPHLYDLTLKAVDNLYNYNKNQAIVISGESGAGKTESTKNAMKCITYYVTKLKNNSNNLNSSNQKNNLDQQILSCNPILEAFGNAKTLRNDNSSRFGKYVTINIDVPNNQIEGAQISTYLLEKSRVIGPIEGERNYHIFYYLLKAEPSFLKELFLNSDPLKYKFLTTSKCVTIDNLDDALMFKEVVESFKIIGFTDIEIKSIFKIIAACLLLGNINFLEQGETVAIEDRDGLFYCICTLIGVDDEALELALTHNIRVIQGQKLKTPLNVNDCINYRNAFVKELYNRTFNYIITRLNKQLAPDLKEKETKYIGLLDIFGFECFQQNSLEQFCINFTNEKLQQLYINEVFKGEQQEFINEGLKDYIHEINFKDNQNIIDAMDKAGSGIFQLLDDMCITNKDDKAFFMAVSKALNNNKSETSALKIHKLATNRFSIHHTAKEVEYMTNGFVNKNLDELKQTMIECLLNSGNEAVKLIFFNALDEEDLSKKIEEMEEALKSNSKKESKYLGGKFRNEMNKLMFELTSCECHYVRCLKPNEIKQKELFIPTFVFQQIKYLGILDTIRVRKDGFPNRRNFKEFFFRYEDVCWFTDKKFVTFYKQIKNDIEFRDLAIKCLEYMEPNYSSKQCLIGFSKIFMKQNFFLKLEKFRTERIMHKEQAITQIQKFTRTKLAINFLKKLYAYTKYLQTFYRTNRYYIKTQKMRNNAKIIQSTFRAFLSVKTYKLILMCIYKLVTVIRSFITRQKIKKQIKKGKFLNFKLKQYLEVIRAKNKAFCRRTALNIFDKAWKLIVIKYKIRSSIIIQAHVRGFLKKIKHWVKVKKGRNKRIQFIINRAATLIQKNYKCFKLRTYYLKALFSAFKIQGYWKLANYSALIKEMRIKAKILQKNIRIYLIRKNVIESRLTEYFKEENKYKDKISYETTKILFPNLVKIQNDEMSDFFGDIDDSNYIDIQQTSNNINNNNLNGNINLEYCSMLPSYDPYGEPKISVFAKILDIDMTVT